MNVFSCAGSTAAEVLASLRRQGPPQRVPAVLYFAADALDAKELAVGMAELFPPPCVCLGCSAAAGLTNAGLSREGMVATAFDPSWVDAAAGGLVTRAAAGADPRPAWARIGAELGCSDLAYAAPDRYVALVLAEGTDYGQDRVLERLGDRSMIPLVGGTASDGLAFARTWVALGTEVARDAVALCVLKMRRRFVVAKTQSLRLAPGRTYLPGRFTGNPLVINTLGGRRARDVLLEAGGVAEITASDADVDRMLEHNVLGLSAGGEVFAFVVYKAQADGSVLMHAAPRHDLPLAFLEWTDTVADLRRALARIEEAVGGRPALLLDFLCAFRALRLEREGRVGDYLRVYDGVPAAGFATFGEAYHDYAHVNATSTFLAVGPA